MSLELISRAKCFNGYQKVFRHYSSELNCSMKFSAYEPYDSNISNSKETFNVLFYLSGLTCSEENFIFKSGFQKYASEHRIIVIGPDTSPRGLNLPGEKDSWDFGEGAGAYLDALKEPWNKNYRMYSYVSKELPKIVQENFPCSGKFGIFGHSMGGHGALVIGLRNPEFFTSISAFAPIVNPINVSWGKDKALKNYLGEENKSEWELYDATELVKKYNGPHKDILIDQGLSDEFLEELLKPKNFESAAKDNSNISLNLRFHEGYNHSYYFVSTFIDDHFRHHAKSLKNNFLIK